MPSVSVIIPAFNRRNQLARAIDAVLSQSETDFTLVVVDDASEDDLSALQERVEGLGHIWIRCRENVGPAAARNCGVASVNTEWIAFLDSDDEWMPDKLQKQLDWHKAHPGFRISQVREDWIRDGKVIGKPKHWEQQGGDLFSESVERCAIGPSCVMIRRDLWNETGGFDERYRVCEDYELWLRITMSEQVGLIPGAALVRKHGGHADQLSTAIPALDRFRLVALAELLENGELTESQVTSVAKGIETKARILEAGARKRGALERAEFYRRVAEGDRALLSGGPDPVPAPPRLRRTGGSDEWSD